MSDQNFVLLIIVIVIIVVIIYIISDLTKKVAQRNKKINDYLKILSDYETNIKNYQFLNEKQRLEFDKNRAEIKVRSQEWAIKEFEKFKTTELDKVKKLIDDNSIAAATNLLQKWKIEYEAKIRQDAANRSYSVILGKVTEHLIPFHTNFPFNPQDSRFIGSPIDLIVFDGLSDGDKDIDIYFVEIKTGKSRFSIKQQRIKSAVDNRRIIWYPVNAKDF